MVKSKLKVLTTSNFKQTNRWHKNG